MTPVKCCIEGCKEKGFLKTNTIPIDWNAHWYCINHRGNSPFTTKLQDPPHQMPKPIVSQQPEITLPATPELKEAFGIEDDPVLTVQQEADLDQAAYEWAGDLMRKGLVFSKKRKSVSKIIAKAMKGACLAQIKEIKRLRAEVAETAEHLGKVTQQAAIIANYLSLQTALADEGAKALDVMSRQSCECIGTVDEEGTPFMVHHEGCSRGISIDALTAIKKLMEEAGAE